MKLIKITFFHSHNILTIVESSASTHTPSPSDGIRSFENRRRESFSSGISYIDIPL